MERSGHDTTAAGGTKHRRPRPAVVSRNHAEPSDELWKVHVAVVCDGDIFALFLPALLMINR